MFLTAIIRQLDLLTILMLLYLAYVAPSIIALARGQSSVLTILTVNILLGWTIIGWIASLTWALEDPEPPSPLSAGGTTRPRTNSTARSRNGKAPTLVEARALQ